MPSAQVLSMRRACVSLFFPEHAGANARTPREIISE